MIPLQSMQLNEADLLRLAGAVADGAAIDWDHAEASASSDAERDVIRQLRALATVAEPAQVRRWGPLEIRGEVGSGVFGTVYRAWDPRLEREVALKLLHVAPLGDPGSSNAIDEGRLLARIRHPNVVTVFGADTHDGRVGVWMEFVTGRTLKDVVTEHGPLGPYEAALVGRDLCRALAAVHKAGVLHRDIKAQNVMREAGGRTLLMDFGAGSVANGEDKPLRGTPAYLAPELLTGASPVPTIPSDLYSLGVLLYFLVAGDFPITAASIAELRERQAAGARRCLRDVRPDLPSAFVRVIDACLEINPANRPASAGTLEALLEQALGLRDEATDGADREFAVRGASNRRPRLTRWRLAAAAATAACLLAAAPWMIRKVTGENSAGPTGANSIVVLPFRNLTGDIQNEYLSEGITDDLAAHLGVLDDLRVVAGTSVRRQTDPSKTEIDIGKDFGVAAVLSGSVRRVGDRVKIVASLTDVRTGDLLWSDGFERDLKDMLLMQSEVARRIAVALRGTLSPLDDARFAAGLSKDPEAFQLYLKGRYYWSLRTADGLNRSIRYFTEALAQDPSYASAHAGVADAYTALGTLGIVPRTDAFARAAAAAEHAIALDPDSADSHAALAYARKNRFEWAESEASFRRAIALKPNHSTAHHWYSILLTQHGRFDEATTEIKTAVFLDPIAIGPKLQLASLLLLRRRYAEAVEQFEKAIQIDGSLAVAHRSLAQAYTYDGRYAEAAVTFERAVRATPAASDDHETKAAVGYLHAVAGRHADALAIAGELTSRYHASGEAVAASIAAIYAGLKQNDAAFEWLTRACDARDPEVGYLKVDPRWDPVRGDRRFAQLLEALGLGDQRRGDNNGRQRIGQLDRTPLN